jgi:hypothetical protein
MTSTEAPAGSDTASEHLALRLPAPCWGLLLYAAIWLAFSPYHVHLTSSVEADFPGYAGMAEQPLSELSFHGLMPVGYPLLLKAVTPMVGEPMRSGVLLSALGGAWFLLVAYALARRFVSVGAALYLQVLLALNWFVLKGSLLAGTDILWAAAVLQAVLLLLPRESGGRPMRWLGAGALLGFSFTLRYATLSVLPVILLWLVLDGRRVGAALRMLRLGSVALAAVVFALPQWWLALRDAGNPLANWQAKNVWFGMFGHSDWVTNWRYTPADASFLDLVQMYPDLLLENLARNLGEFAAMSVTGLLGFLPGSLVEQPMAAAFALTAVGGLIVSGARRGQLREFVGLPRRLVASSEARLLCGIAVVYGASISLAFWMARFFLLVLPLALLAAVVAITRLCDLQGSGRSALRTAILAALPLMLLGHSVAAWTHLVSAGQQPIDQIHAALVAAGIRPDEDVVMTTTLQHYAVALPFSFTQLSLDAQDLGDLQLALALSNSAFLIYEYKSSGTGSYWPELDVLLRDPGGCSFLDPLLIWPGPPRIGLFRAL